MVRGVVVLASLEKDLRDDGAEDGWGAREIVRHHGGERFFKNRYEGFPHPRSTSGGKWVPSRRGGHIRQKRRRYSNTCSMLMSNARSWRKRPGVYSARSLPKLLLGRNESQTKHTGGGAFLVSCCARGWGQRLTLTILGRSYAPPGCSRTWRRRQAWCWSWGWRWNSWT